MSLAKCLKKLKIDSSHEDSIISGLASLTEQGNLEGYRKATLALDQAMNDTLDEQEDIHIQLEKQGYSFKEDNSVKDSKLLEEKLNKQGYTFTITPKSVRDFVAKDKTREAQATTATNLASKFGKRITWIDAKGDFGINGVVVPNIKDVIFLDVNTKYPAHAVMGHELSHHLEYDKPDVYKDLVASMEGLLKNHKEYADKYKIEGASHKDIVKEMIGDIMGDNFTKQDFWNKLADQDRSLFTKIADTIKAWLEQFIKSDNLGSDAFVKDVKKAREVIALAVAKYKDVQQPTQSAEAKFSRAPSKLDADYMAAVNSGDIEKAQQMIDEAAREKGYISGADYRMMHQAPNRDDYSMATIKEAGIVPDDYWTHPHYYQNDATERASFYTIKTAIESKSQKMWVYRSVPKDVKDDHIRNGDWVSPSREYAKLEGESIPGGYKIIAQRASLKDLWWDVNSINEIGYDDGKEYAYKNTKNNRKLLDAVTYDDEGNVIPLSKRFNSRKSEPKFSRAPSSLAAVEKSWDSKGIASSMSERNGIITLNKIVVPKDSRNVGMGTAAMRELTNYADTTNQQIALTPSADFGGNKVKLQAFYKRLGFRKNNEFNVMESMIRDPESAKFSRAIPYTAKEPIASNVSLEDLKAHPKYQEAKHGNLDSAISLVNDLISKEDVIKASSAFGKDVIYVPVTQFEKDGINRIPYAIAQKYASETGASINDSLYVKDKAFHTGMKMMERLIARTRFEGDIPKGKYVLVDDVTSSGATLADLSSYIQEQGGDVVGSVLLTNAMRGDKLIADKSLTKLLETKYGNEIRELFGIEPSSLTREEAKYLQGFRTTDELRASANKASSSRAERIRIKALPKSEDVKFSRKELEVSPKLYSKLEQVIENASDKIFSTGKQVKLWLQSNAGKLGVKKDEIYWSGIDNWLDAQGKVSKQQVVEFVQNNGVQVEDKTLSTAPKNFRSRLRERTFYEQDKDGKWYIYGDKANEADVYDTEAEAAAKVAEYNKGTSDGITKHNNDKLTLPGGTDYKELVVTVPTIEKYNESDNTHFGDTGQGKQIGWLRMDTRDGGLFIEELQSQRAQQGRSEGFFNRDAQAQLNARREELIVKYNTLALGGVITAEERAELDTLKGKIKAGVPPAPFVSDANNKATNAYITLLMKKALIEAVSNDHASVSWTTGDQQADRYDLSKQIERIYYKDNGNGTYDLLADTTSESDVTIGESIKQGALPDYVGKEVAHKIVNAEGTPAKYNEGYTMLKGLDLKTGGEWAQSMYGNEQGLNLQGKPSLISQAANDIFKHVGSGKVESINGQPGFYVTPEMRNKDLPLFSKVAPQDTIKINGIDRPTTNSEGRAIHPTQEGISNFWKWFGDSKVVDEEGRPYVFGGFYLKNNKKPSIPKKYKEALLAGERLRQKHKDIGVYRDMSVHEMRKDDSFGGDKLEQIMFELGWRGYSLDELPATVAFRIGDIPKTLISKDFASGVIEYGVSVVDELTQDNQNTESFYDLMLSQRGARQYVAGFRNPYYDGADGEPLLLFPIKIDGGLGAIKSSLGNSGEFSSSNNDIRFSKEAIPEETTYQKSQRTVQDKFNRFSVIRDWLKERGVKLTELSNVYDAEERYHAKVANQLEDFREKVRNPLIEKIAKAGFTLSDVQDFLLAQHASEANKQIQKVRNDSEALAYGITDEEASEYLSKAKPELAALANELRDVTEQAKQLRLDAGILNKDITDNWDNTYKHYIPVKGDESIQGTGKGLNVKHKDKRRLGHEKRNEAVIENILMDYERAVMEVEKNRVGKYLVMFAAEANNPDLITVGQPEKRNILKENNSYAIIDSNGVIHSVYVNKVDAQRNAPPGSSIQKISDPRVIAQASPMLAPNEVNVYMDGHAIRVQLNDDLLARAYANMGVESVGAIVEAGRVLNSYLSKVYTGYNPEFIVTNIIRDFTSGIVNLTGEEGTLMAVKAIGNYPKMFADLFRYAVTRKSTELIDSYRANGGNTGAAYLSDMERLGKEISREYVSYQGVIANIKAGDGANAFIAAGRKVFNSTLKWIEHLNQAGENAMRLAAYKAMLDSGKTVEQASKVAKNITVNFNRRGEIGQTANALYLFFNASVQGSAAVLHANLRGNHKYQANALAVGMASLGYMLAAGLGGMDEEEYDKIDDTTKERNLIIGSGDSYVKIPIPYGYGFFFNTGRVIADAQRKGEFGKAPFRMAVNAVEELTPFGNLVNSDEINSEQVVGGVAPTALQIPYQMSTNTSLFTGKEIRPVSPFDSSQPEREQMFRNTKGTVYDDMAGLLSNAGFDVSPENIKFLTRTLTGGAGALVDTTISSSKLKAQGAELDVKEMPFIRKFLGENTISNDRSAYYKAVEEATKAAEEFSRARKNNDISSMKKIMEDKRELLAMDKYANKLRKVIKLSRDMQDSVRLNEEIPIAEKRLKLKELEAQESKLYDKYLDVYKARVK